MSKIILNIVEPGTDPTTIDPVVPNTGLFTHGIGGPEATIIVSAVLVLAIVGIIATCLYRKHKKAGKTTKLVNIINQTKAIVKNKKRITAGLMALALLVSAGTFTTLMANSNKGNTNAIEGEEGNLTVNVSDEDLTIEVGDAPVFAVLPVDITVEEATQAGYTLTAYADSTDLVSTTNPDNAIPMIAVEGDELEALTDNTYGLTLEEPTSKDDEIYTTLSTDQSNPTIIKSMPEYTPTEANDTTTIYYGFYITPDIPYGTYTNDSEVYYNATINTTPVTFDGNGLYFNDDPEQTTNEVEYIAVPEEGKEYNINQIVSGEYKKPSQSLPYRFLGWSTDKNATVPTYETEEKIAEFLPISPNTPITLYAVWQKATTITYDKNGGTGDMDTQTIIAGESANLYENTFTRDGYTFTGWNTVKIPTEQTPGKSYADKELYQAKAESTNITLFAQWKKMPYMQDVASWGSTLEIGDEIIAVDNRDDKEYYVARLADGNIWMTQNLDHNIVSTPNFYTYENTDIGHGTTPDPTATWTGAATYPTGTTTWNSSNTAPESYDPGNRYWNGEFNKNYDGTLDTMTVDSGDSHYHIGNYYNWTAAVALSDSSGKSGDVDQSICPAGWRLPNLSEDKSYQNLVSAEDLSAGTSGNIQNNPVYFVYGGYWTGLSASVGGGSGYWSSVVYNSGNSYTLFFNVNGYLGPESGDLRFSGYTLRCVVR